MAAGGIEQAGLSILASRWTEALRAAGGEAELVLGSGRRHPDEGEARVPARWLDELASWCSRSTTSDRLLVVGVPTDAAATRAALELLAPCAERSTVLWESPAQPILDLHRRLGRPQLAQGMRVATLNRRYAQPLAEQLNLARVVVLPIALPARARPARIAAPSATRYAIAVGRLTTRKGALTLSERWIEAVGPEHNLRLLMLGSGYGASDSVEEEIRCLADSSPWIVCHDIGPFEERFARMRGATCGVFAAVDDHLPQALLEVMVARTPVVVTPIDAHLDLVANGLTGVVLSDMRLRDLPRTVGLILADHDASRRLADTAARLAWRRFSPRTAGRALLELLA